METGAGGLIELSEDWCAVVGYGGALHMWATTPLGMLVKGVGGGPGEIRTLDLLNAIEARSQLRHRPSPTLETGSIQRGKHSIESA